MNGEKILDNYHQLLKGDEWTNWDEFQSDQEKGFPRPEVQKPLPTNTKIIDLIAPEEFKIGNNPLVDLIRARKSQRFFTEEILSLEELSFLLWATQGISRELLSEGITYYYRNVASGGNRHPIVTYLFIQRVDGIDPGLYCYHPIEHKLSLMRVDKKLPDEIHLAGLEQTATHEGEEYPFIQKAAVLFIWGAIPYRSEWRYSLAGPKLIAIDGGHICQNLYLAAGAIGAGTCAVGAFNRKLMDQVLGVDGENEFSFYLAPVGKIP